LAVGLDARNTHARWQFQLLVDFPGLRIDSAQLALIDDVAMPANNRTLVWQRRE
jgi:hypothetical protein